MKLTFLSLVFALASAASWEAQQHVGVSDQGSESSTELLRGSSRRLQLPVVALVGNNGNPASAFPLKVCQGDCDSNSDCEGALECFFRDGGEAVPGCSGGERVSSRTDFCYDPNPNPAPVAMPVPAPVVQPTTGGPSVTLIGNNGSPATAFPLKVCQGDCDSNSDCEGALECFFRDGGEAVPGCSGGESVSSRTDFCYDPNPNPAPVAMPVPAPVAMPVPAPVVQPTTGGPSVTLIGNNGSPASAFPLKVCQGDCDSNSDCEGALECFFRDGGEAVPGCSGGESVSSRTDFCYDPNPNPAPVAMPVPAPVAMPVPAPVVQPTTGGPSVTLIGNNGSPASAFPLKVCQGDCDSNSDCEGALECFFRDGGEAVPGCSGGESVSSRTDFCYDPNPNPAPVAMPVPAPVAMPVPAPVVQPTTGGPSVTLIGNNGSPASAFPLKVCQGDCDSNSDCEGALECFFRDGGEAVPGCSGGESVSSRTDFCYDPNPNPAPVAMPVPAPVAMPVTAPVTMPVPDAPSASAAPTTVASDAPTAVASDAPTAVASDAPTMLI